MMTARQNGLNIEPIGYLESPFSEKFGIPRQPGLIVSANARIKFYSPYSDATAFTGLDQFSHIWITFSFDQNDKSKWRPLIRPPRLGGNKKIGIFASRSSFRPNGLGLSAVKLVALNVEKGIAHLEVECPDILDGTPIFDIKPYISYSDSVQNAACGYANTAPQPRLEVRFSEHANSQAQYYEQQFPNLKKLISETLSYDPRPAYKPKLDNKQYGIKLYGLDIQWKVEQNQVRVLEIN